MREMIKAGTVLFKEGTLLPDGLTFESEPFSPGWRSVTGLDGYAMDRKTHDAGWTFFFLAGESRATVFGREGQETIRRAIKKILAGLKSGKFNSLEITRVVFKAFPRNAIRECFLPLAELAERHVPSRKPRFTGVEGCHICRGLNPSISLAEVIKEIRK